MLKAGVENHPQVLGGVARTVVDDREKPVGLVVASIEDDRQNVSVHSVAVDSKLRGQGIASELLERLEEAAREAKIPRLQAVYTSAMESHSILEKLLAKREWASPQPRNYFCRGDVRHVHENAAWIRRIKCPKRFEVFDWSELTDEERSEIEKDIDSGTVPEDLSPFQEEETLNHATSVGIRSDGKVVGWQTNHSLLREPGVIRYSYTYAYPEFQRTGRAFILIKEAIQRNMERCLEEFPRFVSSVAYHRAPMLRFYERHLTPVSETAYSSYGVVKELF